MKRKTWIYGLPVKILMYFILQISFYLTIFCMVCGYFAVEGRFWTKSEERVKRDIFVDYVRADGRRILYQYLDKDWDMGFDPQGTNLRYELFDEEENLLQGDYQGEEALGVYEFRFDASNVGAVDLLGDSSYTVKCYLDSRLSLKDKYYILNEAVSVGYGFRDAIFPSIFIYGTIAVLSFLYLLHAAGRRRGGEVTPGRFTEIHLDIVLLIFGILSYAGIAVTIDQYVMVNIGNMETSIYFGSYGAAVLLILLLPLFFMSVAVRLKLGVLWKNTLCYQLLHFVYRGVRAGIRQFHMLPLVSRVILGGQAVLLAEFFLYLVCHDHENIIMMAWILKKLIFIPLVLYIAIMLRILQKGGKALAEGKVDYRVPMEMLSGEAREHAENLSSIGEGMNKAVEERMKSESLKTELIANVSRDVEAPLSAIISYSENIEKEPTGNPRITEYVQVIKRQSERLKKLIKDLLEASEATSGSLVTEITSCVPGALLLQSVEECEHRFRERGLVLKVKLPQEEYRILADSKLLLRVFDNLLSNIYKYALEETRVYISIEADDSHAVLSFKNIAANPPEMMEEELTDRFVRGDKSRNTEGNGLGLAIAKSLIELQRGSFSIKVDGDLFKVTIKFLLDLSTQEEQEGEQE